MAITFTDKAKDLIVKKGGVVCLTVEYLTYGG